MATRFPIPKPRSSQNIATAAFGQAKGSDPCCRQDQRHANGPPRHPHMLTPMHLGALGAGTAAEGWLDATRGRP
ncbi:MAG: hypothetical protein K9G71_10005 [Rhodobacteraceae bacterium]|nr:hypothetical protein [Paracoccaceae bacterium]MCF8514530.1 hypothetical protein [Paracoccaceae bacterium]MCF8518930.1 hypothetical protein [Paracoccaceae bacterium]